MTKDKDLILTNGIITEILPNQTFRVKLENEFEVICYTSGKMRKFNIQLVKGDTVQIELSPYDLTKGRITFRNK